MKKNVCYFFYLVVPLVTVTHGWAQGKGGGGCVNQNIPLRVTIIGISGGVLAGDNKGATYQDGVDGVSARINISSGTFDATVILLTSKHRTIRFTFPNAQPDSSLTGGYPTWAPGVFQAKAFFNVRNILHGRNFGKTTFSTRMAWQFDAPDGVLYRLRFMPPDTDAPDLHTPDIPPGVNEPQQTSFVVVTDHPGNCGTVLPGEAIVYDQWDVTATVPNIDGVLQLGTVHKMAVRPKDVDVHYGQFSMPYKLVLEALRCF